MFSCVANIIYLRSYSEARQLGALACTRQDTTDCHASAAREQSALHVQSETTRETKYATREFYYDCVEQ